jgi:hypothetical protein
MPWMRYPGRLAHLTIDGSARAINLPIDGQLTNVGSEWRATCSRTLRLFFDDRPWSADFVDPFELRAEEPRGWCIRCAYWSALDALILPERSFEAFVARVQTGHYELVPCSAAGSA